MPKIPVTEKIIITANVKRRKANGLRRGLILPDDERLILGRRRTGGVPDSGVVCCGFECETAVVSGVTVPPGHMQLETVYATASHSTTIARNGGRSLRLNPSNQTSGAFLVSNYNQTVQIGRVYIYFASLPTTSTSLIYTNAIFGFAALGIGYHQPSGEIRTFTGNLNNLFGASGVAVTTGIWYCVDYRFDNTAGAKTADGRVDGAVLAQKTTTNPTTFVDTIHLGTFANKTFDIYYDDFFAHPDETLYPLGAGYTKLYLPSADGAHNTQGCFSISDGETGSYTLIDEIPMDVGVPSSGDSIIQTAANTSAYVEHLFSPVGGAPSGNPRGVDLVFTGHSNDTVGGNYSDGFWKMVSGSKVLKTQGLTSTSIVDSISCSFISTISSANFNWTLDKLNNLKIRFGFSTDADPGFHYDGAAIEAEFPE